MENEFKYEIWDLPSYIMELESTTTSNLTEDELEDVSGGIVNRKLTASVLASLSVLAGTANLTKSNVSATPTTSVSQKVEQSQTIDSEVTKEQAIEDINYVLKVIKDNHVSAVEKMPDEVTAQAKIEIGNLKDKVSVIEEWRIISRILAKLHDAHTSISNPEFLNNRLPVGIKYENKKPICASGEFESCEIVAINDIPILELYKIFQSHYSYEIEEWTEFAFFESTSTSIPEWKLALCGIDTSKPIKVSFQTPSGVQSKNFNVTPITATPRKDPVSWVSYEIDEKNSLGIFRLRRCIYNDEYMSTMLKFFKEISEKKIKNIAIDLRYNMGGDSHVAYPFALALKKLTKFKTLRSDERKNDEIFRTDSAVFSEDYVETFRTEYLGGDYDKSTLFDGKVFLLTSHATFSSAVQFATLFSDNNLATIVGEVPGNSPTRFGNLRTPSSFTPNSGLKFSTSFKKFYRPDETKDGTKLIPDVQVPAKNALNKVYEIIKNNN